MKSARTDVQATRLVFLAACQDRLEMRRLFLARHDADFDFLETGGDEPVTPF